MAKLFISQPMRGLKDSEIKWIRACAIGKAKEYIRSIYGPNEPVKVLDSFFEGAPHNATPLWYLGESIKLLGQADVVYFVEGWEKARGCLIEHNVAMEYGVKTVITNYGDYTGRNGFNHYSTEITQAAPAAEKENNHEH